MSKLEINLCDWCTKVVPECMPEKIVYGEGIGNDNVVECSEYECEKSPDLELFFADPDCNHHIVGASGGGVICTKCKGWFCF